MFNLLIWIFGLAFTNIMGLLYMYFAFSGIKAFFHRQKNQGYSENYLVFLKSHPVLSQFHFDNEGRLIRRSIFSILIHLLIGISGATLSFYAAIYDINESFGFFILAIFMSLSILAFGVSYIKLFFNSAH